MVTFISIVVSILIVLLLLSIFSYAVLLFVVYTEKPKFLSTYLVTDTLKASISKNEIVSIGIPSSAASALAIVVALWLRFPPSPNGELKLEFFSLTFSGPAGPVTLLVVCFLSFVAAMKLLLMPDDPNPPTGQGGGDS